MLAVLASVESESAARAENEREEAMLAALSRLENEKRKSENVQVSCSMFGWSANVVHCRPTGRWYGVETATACSVRWQRRKHP